MTGRWSSMFSALGIPLVSLGVMLALGLRHPALPPLAARSDVDRTYLIDPDPKMDRSFSIFLRQEAREVTLCRQQERCPKAIAQAVADYNLIAQECTPAVFKATGLPPLLKP